MAFLGHIIALERRAREIHIIIDNLSAHKTKRVAQFLADHPNVHSCVGGGVKGREASFTQRQGSGSQRSAAPEREATDFEIAAVIEPKDRGQSLHIGLSVFLRKTRG